MAANLEVGMSRPFDDDTRPTPRPECGLEEAIDLLRVEVEPRAAWRDDLLRQLREQPTPGRVSATGGIFRDHRWQISPVFALAAALVCMVIGGVGATFLQSWMLASPSAGPAAAVSPTAATRSPTQTIGVRFAVMAEGAARVSLVGDFNGWNPDATPLRLASDGRTWVAMLPLREGRHTYAFVIDGVVVADPAAPRAGDDDFGTPSSLMLVSNAR
jgi:hypothetical protein